MESLATCLMFVGDQHGRAEEALGFYVSLFEDARVVEVERYGSGEAEPEGKLKRARFSLAGCDFIAMDSAREHTPSRSRRQYRSSSTAGVTRRSMNCSRSSPTAARCSCHSRSIRSARGSHGSRIGTAFPGS